MAGLGVLWLSLSAMAVPSDWTPVVGLGGLVLTAVALGMVSGGSTGRQGNGNASQSHQKTVVVANVTAGLEELKQAIEPYLERGYRLVFLGDYLYRRADGVQVAQWIFGELIPQKKAVALLGENDRIFLQAVPHGPVSIPLNFLRDLFFKGFARWIEAHGGDQVLRQLGLDVLPYRNTLGYGQFLFMTRAGHQLRTLAGLMARHGVRPPEGHRVGELRFQYKLPKEEKPRPVPRAEGLHYVIAGDQTKELKRQPFHLEEGEPSKLWVSEETSGLVVVDEPSGEQRIRFVDWRTGQEVIIKGPPLEVTVKDPAQATEELRELTKDELNKVYTTFQQQRIGASQVL